MFGRISLINSETFHLEPNAYSNIRFEQSHNRAFRPDFIQTEQSTTLVLGTLLLFNKKAGSHEIAEYFEKSPQDLSNLDGLFLLVHHNTAQKKLYVINNNYQLTKFYYALIENDLIFSHQLELLLPHLKEKRPHFPALINFLRNGFNQSEQTQIEGVKKLLPSQQLFVERGQLKINNRWADHYKVERRSFSSLQRKLDEYEEIYQNTLKDYLEARKPTELATLLSGGHDTSFLLIQASKAWSRPVHCFTTVFSGWGFSEKSFAEATCKKFGGVFHPQEFSGGDLDSIIDLIHSCEEPVLGSSLPLHTLARSASHYTDTIMGGDGGDTLWGEYHPVGEYHRWVKNWPLAIRSFSHSLARILRDTTDWERFWELEHVAGLFDKEDIYSDFLSELCTYRHFSPEFLSEILDPRISGHQFAKSCMEIAFNEDNFDEALIEGKLLNGFFPYQSFQQTRSMNAFGMEFFLPIVQKDLMNFVNSLPMNWLNGGTTFHRLTNSKTNNRKFHKLALARYLKKEEIYNRSFDIPWHLIWKDRQSTLELVCDALKRRGWFQPLAVDKLFQTFRSQKNKDYELLELKSHGYRIMTLLSIEIWARLFIDSPTAKPGPEVSLDEFLS